MKVLINSQVYVHWIYSIVMFVVPFSCLVVLNIFIFVQVWRASKERMELTLSQKRELGLATMILIVALVFLACNTLALIVNVLEMYSSPVINYLTPISNLLVTVNSSANFVIYCIFGQKFQKILLAIVELPPVHAVLTEREAQRLAEVVVRQPPPPPPPPRGGRRLVVEGRSAAESAAAAAFQLEDPGLHIVHRDQIFVYIPPFEVDLNRVIRDEKKKKYKL
ncbi:unnamed protein product [Notodromas monacha]|uniref:G-protein coupled receptors family 1 profile domain-containing protein n=1 Tax=Notodromas monacha TaxID=399045 RepID=A0A7R9BN17_9CRUS|nr:unnamed protein product [Notodromas monacha]CAG0917129.1 unnamed protein product [Notodromas monacha]